jgi:hypothetical protein
MDLIDVRGAATRQGGPGSGARCQCEKDRGPCRCLTCAQPPDSRAHHISAVARMAAIATMHHATHTQRQRTS